MTLLYSIFFGAGLTAFAYTRLGRRVGYANQQNIFISMGVIFVISTAMFFIVFISFLK